MRPSPTQAALRRATELGIAMARCERAIAPSTDSAHTYPNYVLFMQAHRHRLEQYLEFAPWETRLAAIIEEQEELAGGDHSAVNSWDELHAGIAVPLRCAFWYGWETHVRLKQRYDARVEEARQAASQVQVYHAMNRSTRHHAAS